MSVLVIAEHDHQELRAVTLNAVYAAAELKSGEIDIVVMGRDCDKIVKTASQIVGVRTVYVADDPAYEHQLAENCAKLVASVGGGNIKPSWHRLQALAFMILGSVA